MKITNFKPLVFVSASVLFLIFTIITFIAYGAVEEGTDGNDHTTRAIAKLYYILRFPTHTLLFGIMNSPFFFLGLVYNCLFYGFLTERVISLLTIKKY